MFQKAYERWLLNDGSDTKMVMRGSCLTRLMGGSQIITGMVLGGTQTIKGMIWGPVK